VSVAFRRESDEEHKEPRFELPIPPGPNLVTARGLELIGKRVSELEAALAASEAEPDREEIRRDLRYWRTRHATARQVPPPSGDEIAFGSRVSARLDGTDRTIDIVGDDEAEPAAGRIAFSAPLARALMGAGPGDRVDFAGRKEAIEILAVQPIPGSR